MTPSRTCPNCNRIFTPQHPHYRYCPECWRDIQAAQHADRRHRQGHVWHPTYRITDPVTLTEALILALGLLTLLYLAAQLLHLW